MYLAISQVATIIPAWLQKWLHHRNLKMFWGLVVCDEAHKMSATYFGGGAKYTKRYRLGQLLGGITRHLLLMTATPHNGKPSDFQLFLALLDGDRFEGRFGLDASARERATLEVRRDAAISERRAYTAELHPDASQDDLDPALIERFREMWMRRHRTRRSPAYLPSSYWIPWREGN
jgi:superfamily II DNA or RNA helicase